MKQTKIGSFIEVCTSMGIGCLVALASQYMIFPWFGINLPASSHIWIVVWFTLISIIRSYILRRVFNTDLANRFFGKKGDDQELFEKAVQREIGKRPSVQCKVGRVHELLGHDPRDVAKELGATCILPKSNEIFVDIDSEEAWVEMWKRIDELETVKGKRLYDNLKIDHRPSKSGLPHRHVSISFYRGFEPSHLSEAVRILLQQFFCSDQTREYIKTICFICEGTGRSAFFEY